MEKNVEKVILAIFCGAVVCLGLLCIHQIWGIANKGSSATSTNMVVTAAEVHENPPSLNDYHKMGWRLIVGSTNHNPESHTSHVQISLNGDTNDFSSLRICHVDVRRVRADYARYDGTNESVFVLWYIGPDKFPVYVAQDDGAWREYNGRAH